MLKCVQSKSALLNNMNTLSVFHVWLQEGRNTRSPAFYSHHLVRHRSSGLPCEWLPLRFYSVLPYLILGNCYSKNIMNKDCLEYFH